MMPNDHEWTMKEKAEHALLECKEIVVYTANLSWKLSEELRPSFDYPIDDDLWNKYEELYDANHQLHTMAKKRMEELEI